MANFEELFKNFALAGLLLVCIFGFAIALQRDNPGGEKIEDVKILNDTYGQLIDDLGGQRDQAQNQMDVFETEEPTAGFGSLIFFSVVSAGKVFKGMIVGTFNTLFKLPVVIFGVSEVVASVLSTILIMLFILGLWVLIKLGG